MKKYDVVAHILNTKNNVQERGKAFAPINIALCKYWGKRNSEINLPVTSSLSIALPQKGASTELQCNAEEQDRVVLNGSALAADSEFVKRLTSYLDLFRVRDQWHLDITIQMNIPVAAGLASSACGFASLVLALNNLFAWDLSSRELSILARLGSGSAARSLWHGFVEWHAGSASDGMDSYAQPLSAVFRDLHVGILTISAQQKAISSRLAMQQTVDTSALYAAWPEKVAADMRDLKRAISLNDFSLLGKTAESNALSMHATMISSIPSVCYFLPETIEAMHQVWGLRKQGVEVYFTQDAGPNLKLLFLEKDIAHVQAAFPKVEIIQVFD